MENETRKVCLGKLVKGLNGHKFELYPEENHEEFKQKMNMM